MADQIKKLSAGHSIEVLDAIMTEVEESRGEYESLDARLDEISGGGGGGTSNYSDLTNKPQINSVTLSGNKSLSDLGITYESETAASGGTALSLVTTGEKYAWNNKQNAIDDLSTIRSGAALGATAVQPETGKGLSTNDYTTAEKTKLDDLAEIKSIGTGLNLDDNGELTATGGGSGGTTNYNDLSNKPQINGNTLSGNKTSAQLGLASASDIPTVPITAIQKNGTGITPVSGTVNITVPTTAADVSALPASTKYAAALSLTINSSTFVMTGQLKDQNGDNLGTAQTIDLPLESVVVGGSYNSQTKKVVLTLQNGNTIEFSVADLVSGLQTELSASNKLNPAYINYDSTHRAVSDTEKSTWNGKQDALSAAQLAAVNSGINSEKVAQIESNKNNISKDEAALVELVDGGAKNFINVGFTSKSATATTPSISNNGDGSITLNGANTRTANIILWDICTDASASQDTRYTLPAGTYVACGTGNPDIYLQIYMHDGTLANSVQLAQISIIQNVEFTYSSDLKSTHPYICFRLFIKAPTDSHEVSFDNVIIKPMVCTKAAWDISHAYQPYAMSNAELTAAIQALQAQLANQ